MTTDAPHTLGSLFSGIGGLDLGLERAGFSVKWQVENNPFCIKVLEQHWPSVTRYGNIKEIDWSSVEKIDCVCGGFPCPPVSVAGRRRGSDDSRWLWPDFERVILALHPRFFWI